MERLAKAIEAELLDERARAVPSAEVARRLLVRLRGVDRVAHDRMATDYLDEDGQLRVGPTAGDGDEHGQLGLFESEDD